MINLIPGISLQVNPDQQLNQLDGSILIPALCIVMVLVVIASVSIASQKYKR